jgi:hypothetical protein
MPAPIRRPRGPLNVLRAGSITHSLIDEANPVGAVISSGFRNKPQIRNDRVVAGPLSVSMQSQSGRSALDRRFVHSN